MELHAIIMASLFIVGVVAGMSLLLAVTRGGCDKNDGVWAVLFVALTIRIVLALITYHTLPHDWLDVDWAAYERVAAYAVRSNSLDPILSTGGPSFVSHAIANASVFWLVGIQPIVMRLFSAVFGGFACALVFLLAEMLYNERATATTAGLIAAIWPSFIAWSVQNSKDTFLAFAFLALAYCLLRATRKITFSLLLLVVLLLSAITACRAYLGLVLAPLSALYLLVLVVREHTHRLIVPTVVLSVTVIVALNQLAASKAVIPFIGGDLLRKINVFRTYYSHGSASMQVEPFNSYLHLLAFLPIAPLQFFLRPFPWELGSLNQSLGAFEMLGFYLFLWGMIRRMPHLLRTRPTWMVFTTAVLIVVGTGYGVLEGNLGSMFKHRLPLALLIIAIGSDWLRSILDKRTSPHEATIPSLEH